MKRVGAILVVVITVGVLVVWFGPRTFRRHQLSDARARWAAAAIHDYRWTIGTGCFGPCTNGRPLTITVRNGRVVHAPQRVDRGDLSATPMTVEELFARVERMMIGTASP
jgi:uncharacterized protein DUF6174